MAINGSTRRNLERFRCSQNVCINWGEVLGPEVDKFVSGHADILSCAKDLLLCPLLSAVASCMGPSTLIHITQHWVERPILWTVVAARRGERKSTVFRKVKMENLKLEQEIGALNNVNGDKSAPREIIDEQNIKLLVRSEQESLSESSSVLMILDDLGSLLTRKYIDTGSNLWDYGVLRRSYDGFEPMTQDHGNQKSSGTAQFVNFSANVQAFAFPAILDQCEKEGLLERAILICAPDWCPPVVKSDVTSLNSPSLQSVLSSVRNLHQVQTITYTFSPNGQTELQRCFEDLQKIKERYTDYESCRGCVSFASGHLVRLCAVLTALKNGLAMVNRGSFLPPRIIDQDTVRNVYSLVLCILRQKISLLLTDPSEPEHFENSRTHAQQTPVASMSENEFESTEAKIFKVTTSCIKEEPDTKDVIEISGDNNDDLHRTASVSKIDLSNVPSSSLDFQIGNIRSEPYVPTDDDIMILRDGYTYTSQSRSLMAPPSGGPVFPDQPLDVGLMGQMLVASNAASSAQATISTSNAYPAIASFDSQQQPEPPFDEMDQVNPISNTMVSNSGRPRSLSNRPMPRQMFINKAKLNNKYSQSIYKVPEGEFLFRCCQKIKKLMLTKGRIVTASHACQYRLFPPVPLEQRLASPRTTHPAWAATKFFERLESLGLGYLVVFRGQSIKFQKHRLEDMSDAARKIFAKVRISEEEYTNALAQGGDIPIMEFPVHVHQVQGDVPMSEEEYTNASAQGGDIPTMAYPVHVHQVQGDQPVVKSEYQETEHSVT